MSHDPLEFKDLKKYPERIAAARKKTGRNDAVICGLGKIEDIDVSFAVMDFDFIGGSMGSVVGEKVARTIERAIDKRDSSGTRLLFRWRAHDGGYIVAYADGQDIGASGGVE